MLAPTLFNLFFDAVVSMALERNSGNGLTILFNTNAKLVGDRKKMRKQFLIIPILLYGSASWTPLSRHNKRLQGFVMRCLRIILGILVKQKQRNTDIWAKASIDTVDKMIRKRRLRWLGHVARMEPHRIPRRLLVCKFAGGKRAVGGQKLRWVDVVMRDLKKCKLNQKLMYVA